ncbi:Zinc finger CCCH domain-containing protein 2 [Hibiscus syriacus]|uniref:Zinc finger CCCH domain-containing protein 2 n=1 Tax=Hibiscus syriacus TaxID=106335 RepID=A0A6A3AEV1_HIBSY|nr:zinc finger CCCH domain-containing protein 2-like [Hibiscus syriacus]KAE8703080.1 Zinc finger CCCH domain-containing protein 2 [Hibiscus syriacus]
MSTACDPSHHHLSLNMPFNDIEIPPRKLQQCSHAALNLPSNNKLHQQDDRVGADDPYGSDHFRMYEFKVRNCTRSRNHDWTDCPFVHPGEKARRRDPRRYRYSSTICSDFRSGGGCPRGDDCEFAHGVFECWLHPTRYRTEACKDGKNCKRKVCFFAHSSRELRLLPEPPLPKYKSSDNKNNHCCLFCHPVTSSPTSTLMGLPQFSRSPLLSPLNQTTSFSRVSRYSDRLSKLRTEMTSSYGDVFFNELMSSLETMNLTSPVAAAGNEDINSPWPDVPSSGEDAQQQNAVVCDPDPDIGWVNELLM